MAQTFSIKASRGIGVTLTDVGTYTPGAGNCAIIIGLSVANILGTTIAVTVDHYDGTNHTNIVVNAPILPGGSLVPIGGDQKTVLLPTHKIYVTSNTAASCDALMSVMEATNP